MKEGSFKFIILFLFWIYYCLPSNISLNSYDFVYIDIIPLEVSKNNIGLRNSRVDNKYRISFQTQNWIADNLYFYGGFSPSLKDKIDIAYNLSFGYQKKLDYSKIKNLILDFGYYSSRYKSNSNEEFKWTSGSMIFDIKFKNIHFLPSWTYIFNNQNDENKSFINLDFLFNLNKSCVLKSALQLYDNENEIQILPSISLKYKI